MISKKLLSEVLSEDIHDKPMLVDGYLEFNCDGFACRSISIHELAQMVEDWIFNKGYDVGSGKRTTAFGKGVVQHYCICSCRPDGFYADSRINAVFKSGQWILDNAK